MRTNLFITNLYICFNIAICFLFSTDTAVSSAVVAGYEAIQGDLVNINFCY